MVLEFQNVIKSIIFLNSVCAIFTFAKQDTFLETYQSAVVPYFDKVKVVHNTVLKVNGLHNLKHFVCTLMGRVPACQYQIHYI